MRQGGLAPRNVVVPLPVLFSYVDPVSGSILLQVILAAIIVGIAFFRRSIWRLFRMLFRRKGANDDSPQ